MNGKAETRRRNLIIIHEYLIILIWTKWHVISLSYV
jgi:hypothetical protein